MVETLIQYSAKNALTESGPTVSFFIEKKGPDGRPMRESLGVFPLRTDVYNVGDGQIVELNISRLSPRMRRARILEAFLPGIGKKDFAFDRTGDGISFQTIKNQLGYPKGSRIGAELSQVEGVIKKG